MDGRGPRTPEGENVGVVVNDEDGEGRLSGSRVVTGQREWRLGGGGDGEGKINKTAGILRAEEGHAIMPRKRAACLALLVMTCGGMSTMA